MSSTGGRFGGIFGGSSKTTTTTQNGTRPATSNGSNTQTDSNHSSITSRSSAFTRKPSISSTSKSPKSYSSRGRSNSSGILNFSPERKNSVVYKDNHPLPPARTVLRLDTSFQQRKSEEKTPSAEVIQSPASNADSFTSTTPYQNMLARPGTGYSQPGLAPMSGNGLPTLGTTGMPPPSPTLETMTYQHIHETSSKRISTLDYLRKACVDPAIIAREVLLNSHSNEGRVYWFNTLLFKKPDLQKMPYFDSRKVGRRATNYLLLGLSLPMIVEASGSNALEFLKTLNALLSEFDAFQAMHPADGSTSLSRGRFPQMFKRAATTSSKSRRTSSAAEIGLPMGNEGDSRSSNGSVSAGGANSNASFALNENDLLPGEEYIHLLTPSLPFDPDFYETFATLCDCLIDCYTRLMQLVSTPRECSPVVAEMFTKADAKVRKIIVSSVVKEFEESSRAGVKGEVAGVGRVVLGGLM